MIGAAGISVGGSASAGGALPSAPSGVPVGVITANVDLGGGSSGRMPLSVYSGSGIRESMFTKFSPTLTSKISPFSGGGLASGDPLPSEVYGYSSPVPSRFPLVPVLAVGAIALLGVGYLVMRKR